MLPVRGCRPHSRENWASQLAARYGGPLRFVFAVDSASDPAVPVVTALLRERRRAAGLPGAPALLLRDGSGGGGGGGGEAGRSSSNGNKSPAARSGRARQQQQQQRRRQQADAAAPPPPSPPATPGRYGLRPRRGGAQQGQHLQDGDWEQQLEQQRNEAAAGLSDAVVVAGHATNRSQKIHK